MAEAIESIRSLVKDGKSEGVRLDAAIFLIVSSGVIIPEIGLWDIGPQTADEDINQELTRTKNPFNGTLI